MTQPTTSYRTPYEMGVEQIKANPRSHAPNDIHRMKNIEAAGTEHFGADQCSYCRGADDRRCFNVARSDAATNRCSMCILRRRGCCSLDPKARRKSPSASERPTRSKAQSTTQSPIRPTTQLAIESPIIRSTRGQSVRPGTASSPPIQSPLSRRQKKQYVYKAWTHEATEALLDFLDARGRATLARPRARSQSNYIVTYKAAANNLKSLPHLARHGYNYKDVDRHVGYLCREFGRRGSEGKIQYNRRFQFIQQGRAFLSLPRSGTFTSRSPNAEPLPPSGLTLEQSSSTDPTAHPSPTPSTDTASTTSSTVTLTPQLLSRPPISTTYTRPPPPPPPTVQPPPHPDSDPQPTSLVTPLYPTHVPHPPSAPPVSPTPFEPRCSATGYPDTSIAADMRALNRAITDAVKQLFHRLPSAVVSVGGGVTVPRPPEEAADFEAWTLATRPFGADFRVLTLTVLTLRALLGAAVQVWVFESSFPEAYSADTRCEQFRSFLAELEDRGAGEVVGNVLRDVYIQRYLETPGFKSDVVPGKAAELARRCEDKLMTFFAPLRAQIDGLGWEMWRRDLEGIFGTALDVKARLHIVPGGVEFFWPVRGEKWDEERMEGVGGGEEGEERTVAWPVLAGIRGVGRRRGEGVPALARVVLE